jgi:NADH dehydrogenase
MAVNRFAGETKRVVVLGGGFAGAYAARELWKKGKQEVEVVLLDRHNYLTYYPLLVEAAVGAVEPRHVVVPIRQFLPEGEFRMGEVTGVDLASRRVDYTPAGSEATETLFYDQLIIGVGSVTRKMNVPGLAEHGLELKTMGDAIALRDRAIQLLEQADATRDPVLKKELLTFVVVGGSFTGVELAGELQAFLHELLPQYRNVSKDDIRLELFEHGRRILPALDDELSGWVSGRLADRGVVIHTGNSIQEIGENFATSESGIHVHTRTVVWTAGIAPSPLLKKIEGLPLNEKGYISCNADLSVVGLENVWAIGDVATIFDAAGKPYAATAQNAVRQGPTCARNVLARLRRQATQRFDFKPVGVFCVIGNRQAAAVFLGKKFRGFPGWVMYRGAYLMKMPTLKLKARLLMDWMLEFFLKSPTVQLGVHRKS